jgi:hypothetical protein
MHVLELIEQRRSTTDETNAGSIREAEGEKWRRRSEGETLTLKIGSVYYIMNGHRIGRPNIYIHEEENI